MKRPAGQTVVEKVAQRHRSNQAEERTLHAGDFVTLRPRHVLTHDNTAPVMAKFASFGPARVRDPRQPVFVLDHDIQNTSAANLAKYRAIEAFAREQGIDFWPAGSGIGHQVIVEQLYARPGELVVASDSHANMYGGVACVGTPVVRTDAAAIWATGEFWWRIPRTVQVVLDGALPAGSSGKDVVLALCGLYADDEVLNAAVEFAGAGVAALTVEDRLAIANMTTEWGALVGWFPVDDRTLAYLVRRRDGGTLRAAGPTDAELERWRSDPPAPDADARYAARIRLDLSRVGPHVTGPDTVRLATPLAEIERRRIRVNKAYLVSCVNSRGEDLAAAAAALRGRRVARGVELYVAAASREVQQHAEASGVWGALLAAGARALPPGCGPCIGLGAGLLAPGEVGISATNRNFKGRMGSRDAECWLASPAVVAASAAAGYIRGTADAPARTPERSLERCEADPTEAASVAILDGFPARIAGRLVFLPQDDLDTDAIYGKDHTSRDDMTPEAMARVIFENLEPGLAARLRAGDVIVGGASFGSGSSREQAVTALAAKGVALVVAASFSATYLRNAFNNGFPCLECPALVASLRERWSARIRDGERAIVDDSEPLAVDFAAGTLAWAGRDFPFAPLDELAQALVVDGGIVNRVRRAIARA